MIIVGHSGAYVTIIVVQSNKKDVTRRKPQQLRSRENTSPTPMGCRQKYPPEWSAILLYRCDRVLLRNMAVDSNIVATRGLSVYFAVSNPRFVQNAVCKGTFSIHSAMTPLAPCVTIMQKIPLRHRDGDWRIRSRKVGVFCFQYPSNRLCSLIL